MYTYIIISMKYKILKPSKIMHYKITHNKRITLCFSTSHSWLYAFNTSYLITFFSTPHVCCMLFDTSCLLVCFLTTHVWLHAFDTLVMTGKKVMHMVPWSKTRKKVIKKENFKHIIMRN